MPDTSSRRRGVLAALCFMLVICVTLMVGVAPSEGAQGLELKAALNKVNARDIHAGSPLKLRPEHLLTVHIEIHNGTSRQVVVHSVRFDSHVMGITFFAYETAIDMRLAPGARQARDFQLDLVDLGHLATGYLPARLALLGPSRSVLKSEQFAVDVRGLGRSVYATFGVLIALISLVLVVTALLKLVAQKLSPNRSLRAARFGVAGLGLGLTATFGLSAFRVLLPTPKSWLTIVLIAGLILFVLGYVTPSPEVDEGDDGVDDATYPVTEGVDLRDVAPGWADVDTVGETEPEPAGEEHTVEQHADEAYGTAATVRRPPSPPPS